MVVHDEIDTAPKSTSSVCSDESEENSSAEIEFEEVPAPDDGALQELLEHLEDYTPTVPDALTQSYLNSAGFDKVDSRIARIISVAAQKFISDIANDALQHCKTRTTNSQHSSSSHGAAKDKKNIKDRKYILAMEDLTPALADHGITMRKPQYFV